MYTYVYVSYIYISDMFRLWIKYWLWPSCHTYIIYNCPHGTYLVSNTYIHCHIHKKHYNTTMCRISLWVVEKYEKCETLYTSTCITARRLAAISTDHSPGTLNHRPLPRVYPGRIQALLLMHRLSYSQPWSSKTLSGDDKVKGNKHIILIWHRDLFFIFRRVLRIDFFGNFPQRY